MLSFVEVMRSWAFVWGVAFSLLAIGFLWFQWHDYFGRQTEIRLSIATLLDAISIGVTGVSILLPASGALLFYYLSKITQDKLPTSYPLFAAIVFFGSSLFLGLLNAFSFSTQYPDGEGVVWTRRYLWHALFFASQFIFFAVAIAILVLFFIRTPLDVNGLLKQP